MLYQNVTHISEKYFIGYPGENISRGFGSIGQRNIRVEKGNGGEL